MTNNLVLSLFPNIGLLDTGFERVGFCVVRGPDLIWGGDIRDFYPPENRFDGIIAGSPCQDFSKARRGIPATGNGLAMISEFRRCVMLAQPTWWLLENVAGVPDVTIDGYSWQRLDLYAHEFGGTQNRLRHIQFGSNDGTVIVRNSSSAASTGEVTPTVTASDDTMPISEMARQQGLPADFDIPAFKRVELRRAIGNGVPIPMATALARMVRTRREADTVKLCACHCGRIVRPSKTYSDAACRMRAMRRRNQSRHTSPGTVTA